RSTRDWSSDVCSSDLGALEKTDLERMNMAQATEQQGSDREFRSSDDNNTFAMQEIERRRKAPVFVSGDDVRARMAATEPSGMCFLIDPKLGFSVRSIRMWMNFWGLGEGALGWKELGHRHLIDAVIHILR